MTPKTDVRSHSLPSTNGTPPTVDSERRAYLDGICESAKQAASALEQLDQERVDRIVWAMARAGIEAAYPLAQLAIEETNIGILEDKVIKNYVATEFLYDHLKDKRTVGIIADDPVSRTQRVANPIGVVLAILPLTNPTSTALFKAIVSIKTRNAMVFRPSSRAYRCTRAAIDVLTEAGERAGLPPGALQCLEAPTAADTQYLFAHDAIDFVWTTGGATIVNAANRSGKPTIGVGPGNAPVYLERTADVKMAVRDIIFSKTFDASTICPAEQTAVIDDEIYDVTIGEFVRLGSYVLSPEEADRLLSICFDRETGGINVFAIGQPAPMLAQAAEIDAPEHTKLFIAPLDRFDEHELLLHEKLFPILTVVRSHSHDEALDMCDSITRISGMGHTSAIFSKDEELIRTFAERIRTGRVLVNVPTAIGALGGTYNDLPPTFSLGCGTWGGTTTTDNVNYEHLLNIKHVSHRKTPPRWFRVPVDIYYNENAIENLAHLRSKTAMIVTSPGNARRGVSRVVQQYMPSASVHEFTAVGPEPDDRTLALGVEALRRIEPDTIIAIGGGSVLDAAKVMRLLFEHPTADWRELAIPFLDVRKRIVEYPQRRDTLRMVAIPTTSGTGSEVSPAAVITDADSGRKITLVDYSLVPEVAIVDPQFALTMPPHLTADSGVDALTHAIEALVSVFASPYTDALCLQAIEHLRRYLPVVYREPENLEARSTVHNAASIAGMAFSNAFVGVGHSLAHALGATFGIAHGRACGIFLPHVIDYNASMPRKFMPTPNSTSYVVPERYANAAMVLGLRANGAGHLGAFRDEICRVLDDVEIPRSIEAAGVTREAFERELPTLVERAYGDVSSRTNPRMPMLDELRELFEAAWVGR